MCSMAPLKEYVVGKSRESFESTPDQNTATKPTFICRPEPILVSFESRCAQHSSSTKIGSAWWVKVGFVAMLGSWIDSKGSWLLSMACFFNASSNVWLLNNLYRALHVWKNSLAYYDSLFSIVRVSFICWMSELRESMDWCESCVVITIYSIVPGLIRSQFGYRTWL